MFSNFNEYPDVQEMLREQYEDIGMEVISSLERNEAGFFFYHEKPVYSVEFDGYVAEFTGDISNTATLATCKTDECVKLYDSTFVVTVTVNAANDQQAIKKLGLDPESNFTILKI